MWEWPERGKRRDTELPDMTLSLVSQHGGALLALRAPRNTLADPCLIPGNMEAGVLRISEAQQPKRPAGRFPCLAQNGLNEVARFAGVQILLGPSVLHEMLGSDFMCHRES